MSRQAKSAEAGRGLYLTFDREGGCIGPPEPSFQAASKPKTVSAS
jgi:hypothetical protein